MCTDLYFDCSLHPNTVYTFRVAANNDVGSSNFSAASDEATTLQDSKLLQIIDSLRERERGERGEFDFQI